ncbi:restriction endonuclease subunit S [Dokdonia sp. R86516]|uniref:restriction endonuclease subunit S n=1 Tax=Dokdonia sp. R86516 TaxID=3093856 RepID=UPI0037C9FA8D
MNKKKEKIVPELRFPEFENDGNWAETILDDVADYENGKAHEKEISETGKYKVVNSKFISTEGEVVKYTNSANLRASVGDILMVLSDIPNGRAIAKCFYVDINDTYTVNQRICKITPTDINNKFLFYIQNRNKYFLAFDDGVKQTNLRKDTVLSFPFFKPKNPNEQLKIANCLSSLDTLITAETDKLDHLKDHKKGLLQQLFPANGETKPQYRFPEFENDGNWENTTLGKIAKFRRGSFPQPYGRPEWYDDENGMPFIQVYDVDTNLKIKPKTKRKISALAAEKSVFIAKGTVIITIQGSIGRVAITQYDAFIDRTLLLFEEFYKPIDKLFFAYVIQLLFEIEKEKAPGGIIKTITKEVLTSFNIYVPDVLEQQRIAKCLSSLDDLITLQTQKTKALQKHKKGLMQKLFPNIL